MRALRRQSETDGNQLKISATSLEVSRLEIMFPGIIIMLMFHFFCQFCESIVNIFIINYLFTFCRDTFLDCKYFILFTERIEGTENQTWS